jgi:hypothetical protein
VRLVAEAQQAGKVFRVGYLGNSSASLEPDLVEALRQGLRNLSYVENQNIIIEYRWAEGRYDRFPSLVADWDCPTDVPGRALSPSRSARSHRASLRASSLGGPTTLPCRPWRVPCRGACRRLLVPFRGLLRWSSPALETLVVGRQSLGEVGRTSVDRSWLRSWSVISRMPATCCPTSFSLCPAGSFLSDVVLVPVHLERDPDDRGVARLVEQTME